MHRHMSSVGENVLDEQILQIRSDLAQCQNMHSSIIGILDGFESKLAKLDTIMTPVHERIEEYRVPQKNMEQLTSELDRLSQYNIIAKEGDKKADALNIRDDYKDYLAWFRQVTEARKFFHKKNIRGADKVLRKLKTISNKAKQESLNELRRIISQRSEPLDLGEPSAAMALSPRSPQPQKTWSLNNSDLIPPLDDLVPPADVQKLSDISVELMFCGHGNAMLAVLQEERSSFFYKSILNAWENQLSSQKNIGTHSYQCGTHPAVLVIVVTHEVLKMERELLRRIVKIGDDKDFSARNEECFQQLITHPLENFFKLMEKPVKDTAANRVLISLDVLANIKLALPHFEVTLKNDKMFRMVKMMKENIRQSFLKSLSDYNEDVKQ